MANPIRWDNINGGGLSEASRPLQVAQQSILSGFNDLGQVLAQREAIDNYNFANQKNNNTQAFLDAVSKYRTAEDLKAASATGGALDQLRASYGPQIDAAAVRGAIDQRDAFLKNQAVQNIGYEHAMTDERVAPILDLYRQATLRGDKAAADAAQGQYAAMGGRDLAGLAQYADTRGQQLTERQQAATKASDQHIAALKNLQVADANIAQSNAGVRASDSQVRMNDFNISNTKKLQEAAQATGRAAATTASLKQVGNLYHAGVYDGSQAEDLRANLMKNKDANPEQVSKLIGRINELSRKGIKVTGPDGKSTIRVRNLPMAAITAAAEASHDQLVTGGWNEGFANTMENQLKEILSQNTGPVKTNNGEMVFNKAAYDLQAYNAALAKAREAAPGIAPTRAAPLSPKPNPKR